MALNKKKKNLSAERRGRRSAARLAAVQSLYELEVSARSTEQVLEAFAQNGSEADLDETSAKVDAVLYRTLLEGVTQNTEQLDQRVNGCLSDGRSIARMETVLRAILRAGAFELTDNTDLDPPIIISEYVGLAHAFFGGGEPSIVNGVLDRMIKVGPTLSVEEPILEPTDVIVDEVEDEPVLT